MQENEEAESVIISKRPQSKEIHLEGWRSSTINFKPDVRRLYYTMFQNVLNSYDIELVRSFLQTYDLTE